MHEIAHSPIIDAAYQTDDILIFTVAIDNYTFVYETLVIMPLILLL